MLSIKYIAKTPDQRAQGMRNKPALKEGEAMLFLYDYPERVSFWNRGVTFPLDVGYIDKDGILFQKGTLNADLDGQDVTPMLFSNREVMEVIETKQGELDRYRIGTHKDKLYMPQEVT